MTPDIQSRISTLMASLSDVVIPAVNKESSTAQEQAHLILGSLAMMAEQVDFAHRSEVIGLRALIKLARELANVTGQTPLPLFAAAEVSAADPLTLTSDLRKQSQTIRSWITELVENARPEQLKTIRKLIFAYEQEQNIRDRAWVAGTNFDVCPESLLTIEESLSR
jgi:hypothetical protein